VRARSRLLLLGGTPFEEPLEMWWNLVGRSRAELAEAYDSWVRDDGRFGTVASSLERILTTPPRAPSEDASADEDRRLGGERPWR